MMEQIKEDLFRELSELINAPVHWFDTGIPEVSIRWHASGKLVRVARSRAQLTLPALESALRELDGSHALGESVACLIGAFGTADLVWGLSAEAESGGAKWIRLYVGRLHEHPPARVWAALLATSGFAQHLPPEPFVAEGGLLSIVALTSRGNTASEAKIYSRVACPVQRLRPIPGAGWEIQLLADMASEHKIPHRLSWIQRRYLHGALNSTAVDIELTEGVENPFEAWGLPADKSLSKCVAALALHGFRLRHLAVSSTGGNDPILSGYWQYRDWQFK